jgi:hypothetical protein
MLFMQIKQDHHFTVTYNFYILVAKPNKIDIQTPFDVNSEDHKMYSKSTFVNFAQNGDYNWQGIIIS